MDSIKQLMRMGAVKGVSFKPDKDRKILVEAVLSGNRLRRLYVPTTHVLTSAALRFIRTFCGPMSVPRFSGARYLVSFIDECSGCVTIVLIARKGDVLMHFKLYHVWLERKFGRTVRRLHSDNGDGFVTLREYMNEKGIKNSTSPLYSPVRME